MLDFVGLTAFRFNDACFVGDVTAFRFNDACFVGDVLVF